MNSNTSAIVRALAAVDLGSNSFPLEIGQVQQGQYVRQSYLKETVRQGNGLDADGLLSLEAIQRGWDCLERFGTRLQGFDAANVRAVATQTLREAHNRDTFIATGSRLLGFPISVISGAQESALIYQGAAQTIADDNERRLVIDIGGRSTELIQGKGMQAQHAVSCPVGSVAWSMQFFASGEFTADAFTAAQSAADTTLRAACAPFLPGQWDRAYGSAGTVNAVVDVLTAAGWPSARVSRAGLDWLLAQLLAAGRVERLEMPGLREDRKPVIGGGLSILRALFELLDLQELRQCSGGLRHGLLLEMTKKPGNQPGLYPRARC